MHQRVDRYRLLRHLGHGGMGDVYLARLEAVGQVQRLVAIKFLRDADPKAAPGLLREARLTALLSHPNVVQVIDAGSEGDRPWFAMEFVAGLSLADLLVTAGDRLPPWVTARIVADLALGVHALHEAKDERGNRLEIVHRDLSPHNVLVSWDGVVKLLDLGIARSHLWGGTTNTGIVRGKLGYMSPEQAAGEALDRRSDVFALGVLLWEALAGRHLFRGDTDGELLARVIRGDVPPLADASANAAPKLAAVAHRALALRPADRFATALEMQRSLEVAVREAGVIVGADEVARAVATLVPERVHEHEAWLRAADSAPDGPDVLATKSGTVAVSITRDPTPRSGLGARRSLLAAAVLATAGLAVFVAIRGAQVSHQRSGERMVDTSIVVPVTVAAAADSIPAQSPPVSNAVVPSTAVAEGGPAPEGAPTPKARTIPTSSTAARARAVSLDPGTLNVVSSPSWATISLDGKVVGETPLVLRGVSGGTHTLEARSLGTGLPQRRVVSVLPGAATRVEFAAE